MRHSTAGKQAAQPSITKPIAQLHLASIYLLAKFAELLGTCTELSDRRWSSMLGNGQLLLRWNIPTGLVNMMTASFSPGRVQELESAMPSSSAGELPGPPVIVNITVRDDAGSSPAAQLDRLALHPHDAAMMRCII